MSVHYSLLPNKLTDDPNDYKAVVSNNNTLTQEEIIERMADKGSTLTKAEILSVIEEYEYTISKAIEDGQNISTNLFKTQTSIGGVFWGKNDSFDASRHKLRLNLQPGARLKKALSNTRLRKTKLQLPKPNLCKFIDLKSGRVNETFTPGQIASLQGTLLKFDESDKKQGIFFIAENGTEIRIANVSKNKPSELLFFTPESLSKGKFQVEVRTILHHSSSLKKGRLFVTIKALST